MYKYVLTFILLLMAASIPQSASAGTSSKIISFSRSPEKLSEFLYSLNRPGVTINKVEIFGSFFIVTGNYSNQKSLKKFIEKIEQKDLIDKKLTFKTGQSSFAGKKTYSYVIRALNVWI